MTRLRVWVRVVLIGWLLFEGAFAALVTTHLYRPNVDGTYYSGSIRRFDPVRGYRWVSSGTRIARIMKGDLAFDNRIRVNSEGYIGARSCLPRKNPETYRFVVLGDSFTDASYLPRTWVDTANALAASAKAPRVEFCSFAVDGGGLLNWDSSLRDYIVPTFDFDGVILAVFGDDLVRGFIAFTDDTRSAYFRMLPQAPSPEDHQVESSLLECPAAPIVSENDIGFLIGLSRGRVGWRPNASRYAWLRMRNWRSTRRDPASCHFYLSPAERDRALERMLRSLLGAGKTVVVATVPGRGALEAYIKEGVHTAERDFDEALARREGLRYFDGYKALASNRRGPAADYVNDLWLPHDGHWNQNGSDLFGLLLFEFLQQDVLLWHAAP